MSGENTIFSSISNALHNLGDGITGKNMAKYEGIALKLKDGRTFVTHKQHFQQLIEFANTFDATIQLVETNVAPLDMNKLASALGTIELPQKPVQVIDQKSKSGEDVIKYICSKIENQEVVSLAEMKKIFPLSLSYLSNIFSSIRNQYSKDYDIVKKSPGCYAFFKKVKFIFSSYDDE